MALGLKLLIYSHEIHVASANRSMRLRQHFTAVVKKDNMFFHIDECKVDTPSAASLAALFSSMKSTYETNAKDGLFIFVYERVDYEPVILDPSVVLTSDPSLVGSTGVDLQQTELHIDVKLPVTSSELERCDQVQAECTSTVHEGNVPHAEMDLSGDSVHEDTSVSEMQEVIHPAKMQSDQTPVQSSSGQCNKEQIDNSEILKEGTTTVPGNLIPVQIFIQNGALFYLQKDLYSLIVVKKENRRSSVFDKVLQTLDYDPEKEFIYINNSRVYMAAEAFYIYLLARPLFSNNSKDVNQIRSNIISTMVRQFPEYIQEKLEIKCTKIDNRWYLSVLQYRQLFKMKQVKFVDMVTFTERRDLKADDHLICEETSSGSRRFPMVSLEVVLLNL